MARSEIDQLWEIIHRLAWAPYAPENMVVQPSDSNDYALYKEKIAAYYTETVIMASDLTSACGKHQERLNWMQTSSPTLDAKK